MSVVVQSMIPSEVSGVLFTVNPVNGNRGQTVINASWGLGEAIVSGLVSPDTITADKNDGRIINCQAGSKEIMVAYAVEGGTEELPVPEAMRAKPALSDQQVAELTRLGNQIETYYGRPQDIEWGFYNGNWYLLQSRPITTLTQKPEQQYPPGEFNRSMFIEIFPEALSPSFLSVITPIFKEMLDFTFRALGFEPPKGMQGTGGFNQLYLTATYRRSLADTVSSCPRTHRRPYVNPFGDHKETASYELSWPYTRMMFRVLHHGSFFQAAAGLLSEYRAEIKRFDEYPFEISSDTEICEQINSNMLQACQYTINYDF
jgi:pyruvate,water dikinase